MALHHWQHNIRMYKFSDETYFANVVSINFVFWITAFFLFPQTFLLINFIMIQLQFIHCIKSVCFWNYSGPHFPVLGLDTERYGTSLHIYSEYGKIRTRITPNLDAFYAVISFIITHEFHHYSLFRALNFLTTSFLFPHF